MQLESGNKRFITCVVTPPENAEGEQTRIAELIEAGVDFVHLRKPGFSRGELIGYIKKLPEFCRGRIRLHDHFDLCAEFGLGGIHLNSRNPDPCGFAGSISKSCHEIDELSSVSSFDYVTLSPVFNSISKLGYEPHFRLDDIKPELTGKRVVALGGITPDKFGILLETGFAGAALLGYIWNDNFHQNVESLRLGIAAVDSWVRANT